MRTFINGEAISWVDTYDRIKFIQNKNTFYSLPEGLKVQIYKLLRLMKSLVIKVFLISAGNLQTTTSYTIEIIKNDIKNTTTTILCRNFYLNQNRWR